jgi:hypothetical protein
MATDEGGLFYYPPSFLIEFSLIWAGSAAAETVVAETTKVYRFGKCQRKVKVNEKQELVILHIQWTGEETLTHASLFYIYTTWTGN